MNVSIILVAGGLNGFIILVCFNHISRRFGWFHHIGTYVSIILVGGDLDGFIKRPASAF